MDPAHSSVTTPGLANEAAVVEACGKVLALDPKNVRALQFQGIAQRRLKRYDEAIETLKRALEIEPDGPRLPRFAAYERNRDVGNFMAVFPNVGISVTPDHVAISIYQPIAADRTYYRKDLYFIGDAATDPALEPARQAVYRMWDEINDQDHAFMAPLQANHGARDRLGVANRLSPAWLRASSTRAPRRESSSASATKGCTSPREPWVSRPTRTRT